MAYSLIIAKYRKTLIGVGDYQETVHKSNITCPFCEDNGKLLRVKFDSRGYFAAWPNEGGHICGRGKVDYLDSDWEGRELVEIICNEENGTEVTIDIYSGFRKGPKSIKSPNIDKTDISPKSEYNKYKKTKKIFRDVIRTVKQMKAIIESNEISSLRNLNFKYKVGNGELISIDELLIMPQLIKKEHIGKNRFVLLKAANPSNWSTGKKTRFLNAYSANGIGLSVAYNVVENENPFHDMKDEFILAFGKIQQSKDDENKYILWINNDYHLERVEQDFGELFFKSIDFKKYAFPEKDIHISFSNKVKITENVKISTATNSVALQSNKTEKLSSDLQTENRLIPTRITEMNDANSSRSPQSKQYKSQNFKTMAKSFLKNIFK